MLRRVALVSLACVCLLVTPAFAEDEPMPAPPRPPTPYGLLYKDWKAETVALDKAEPELSAVGKREKKREINTRYASRFVELAERHWGEDAVQCMIWMTNEADSGPASDKLWSLLEKRSTELDRNSCHQLQLLMSFLVKVNSDRMNPALEAIVKDHENKGLKGTALYALAARLKNDAEQEGDIEKCRAVEAMLERVISEFPDEHTYFGANRETATAMLDQLRGPAAIGKVVPDVKGLTIDGSEFRLLDAVRGKVAVISFSGHWCRPCVAMHPVQKELLAKYSRDQVVIVEMNSDPKESSEKVKQRIEADGLKWIVVAEGSEHPISDEWKVSAWPTFVVVDAAGVVRRRVSGNLGRLLIDWVDRLVQPQSDSGSPMGK